MARIVEIDLGDDVKAQLAYPDRDDYPKNLGGAIQYSISYLIVWIAETSGRGLGTLGSEMLISFLERIEPKLIKYYAPVIDEVLKVPGLPDWFKTFMESIKSPESEAGAAVLSSVIGSAAGGITSSLLGALTAELTYAVNRFVQGARPGLLDALMMHWRDPERWETVRGWLLDQGWSDEQIGWFYDVAKPRIPPGELVTWAWRTTLNPEEARGELYKRGYDTTEVDRIFELSRNLLSAPDVLNWSWRANLDPTAVRDEIVKLGYKVEDADRLIELSRNRLSVNDAIMHAFRTTGDPTTARDDIIKQGYPAEVADQYLELAKFIAPVQDLIRMAVREAFSPEIAEKFGQYEDFPQAFADWAIRQGMTEDWAKAYWAAHWDLPSVSMGFEMLHRGIINTDDLTLLLRALDVMPYWRDRLIQLSYNPFTRVDVRRMHKLGVLSEAEVFTAYKDIGYDDTKAAQLTEFTVKLNTQEETEFTVSNVLAGYNAGVITGDEAFAILVDMGKSKEYAAYVLTVEDYEREKSLLTEKVNNVKTLYVNWEIDRGEAQARLGELDVEPERVKRFLESWDISRQAKITLPTIAQIEEWYKDGIFSETQAREEIHKRRYQDYVVDVMVADWDQQIAVAAQKAVDDAEKEAERVKAKAVKQKRDIAIANLNLLIAELRWYIADLKVSIYQAVDPEQKTAMKGTIVQLQEEIARLQLEKAGQYITE